MKTNRRSSMLAAKKPQVTPSTPQNRPLALRDANTDPMHQKFKATPVNRKIFKTNYMAGIPKLVSKEPTKVQPFTFHTEARMSIRRQNSKVNKKPKTPLAKAKLSGPLLKTRPINTTFTSRKPVRVFYRPSIERAELAAKADQENT